MDDRHKSRLQSYKNAVKTTQEMRTRRHEVSVELRKSKKEEQMLKRRNIADENVTSTGIDAIDQQSPITLSIDDIIIGVRSTDKNRVLEAVRAARKILSREKNPPIDVMITNGIVPIFVEYLDHHDHSDIQFEASWALTNVASGNSEQTLSVVSAGAIPKFVNLLKSPFTHIAEQAVWALGNIAGDGPTTRDTILAENVLDILVLLVHNEPQISFLRNIVWLMSNLCRSKKPAPPFDKVQVMLSVLAQLLQYNDVQVLTDASWAVSYVTDDENSKIQAVVDAGIVPHLIHLLDSAEVSIIIPALRSVGNIVTGSDDQTDSVIEHGGLIRLKKLLQHEKNGIVKEATWAISNITAGNPNQIQCVIEADIFPVITGVLEKGDARSQKEATWVITNATTSGSTEQIATMTNTSGLLKAYCDLLNAKDGRTVKVVLTGLSNLLQLTDKVGGTENMCYLLEELGALDKLELLQNHENEEIYNKAFQLIEKYFADENAENVDIAPKHGNGQLEFSASASNVPEGGFNF